MGTSEKFTPTAGVNMVNRHLADLGFTPRDSDGNDFASPQHDVRFKTGCSYGEVTTQVVRPGQTTLPIRATSWAGIDRMLIAIAGQVDA